jgi:hypothetical protein
VAHESQSADGVAALAVSPRQDVDHALRAQPTDAGGVEGRFLRRLIGALSAFETAQQIAAPSEPGRALSLQRCPACGSSEFEAVSGGWVVHLVCRRCDSCARAGRRGLVLTNAATCPGCDFAERCTNRAGER